MNYAQILAFARELRKNQTPAENIFWQNVRNRKFLGLKFNRQFVIEHAKRSYFIADFHCFEKKLIIEIDGEIHNFQIEYDQIREDILVDMGYQIIRFENDEVLNNWDGVEKKLISQLSPDPSLQREGDGAESDPLPFEGGVGGGLKRIAIIGPESTGKSELCQHLATHYQTEWVPEFARFYLDRLDRPYEQVDLKAIAEAQLQWEDDKAAYANNFLFCDTNLVVIKIWSDHKYGNTDPWIEKQLRERSYDFYLLNDIDIPWAPDPQREHPTMRKHFFDIYESYLTEHNLPYAIVSGIEGERKECAVDALKNFFN